LFAAVRRRHPDVDIVLLPPPDDPAEADPASDADLAAALDLTTRIAAPTWALAGGLTELPDPRFAFGSEPGCVLVRVRASAHLDDSPLDRIGALLAGDGWTVGHLPGTVDRIVARHPDGEVVASYAAETGTFVLTVASAPMTVGADRARGLVRR
jgi:hypothetical protein